MFNESFGNNDEEETSIFGQSYEEESLDPDDLIFIRNPSIWDPTEEYILAYARHLSLDISNDSPQLINVIKKYLLKPLPSNLIRAFRKDNLQIYYVDEETREVHLENDLDNECKKEYENMKKSLMEEEEKKKESKKKKKGKGSGKNTSKSKSKKKKKKKSRKNSSEHTSNIEDKSDNDKVSIDFDNKNIDEKNLKKYLLIKQKEKYLTYKEKEKNNYIKAKKDTKKNFK